MDDDIRMLKQRVFALEDEPLKHREVIRALDSGIISAEYATLTCGRCNTTIHPGHQCADSDCINGLNEA